MKYTKKLIEQDHKAIQKSLKWISKEIKSFGSKSEVKEWQDVKVGVQSLSKRLQEMDRSMPKKAGLILAWYELEDIVDGKSKVLCPVFYREADAWWKTRQLYHAPLYHEVMNVAFDISRGFSLKEAKRLHQKWLDADDSNRLYDVYYYHKDGTITNMSKNQVAEA